LKVQRAVRNAIEIYEREIAGGQTQTNIDAIVDEALARARSLVDAGKSGLAQAALRKAAEKMRREEEERRERYIAEVTALYNRTRDIALASYDGAAAANAIISLAEAIHGSDSARVAQLLNAEAESLYEYGRIAAATCFSSHQSRCGGNYWVSLHLLMSEAGLRPSGCCARNARRARERHGAA
jgi:hypothetical protein